MPKRADNLHGTLEMLILETLDYSPQHGFGIVSHVQTASDSLLRVEEGSLYPALHRLEREKLVTSAWRVTENSRKAKLYSITASGRARLATAKKEWKAVSKGVKRVLQFQQH